jgi:type II secretory pathway pseudopilin PulG
MDWHRISSRSVVTWVELAVVIIVVAIAAALLVPAVNQSREAARRCRCDNQLRQIGLGVHTYAEHQKVFPPGVTCSAANITADAANPWADAKLTTKGASGTSWILLLLPYLEAEPTSKAWNFEYGVGDTRPYTTPGTGNQGTTAAPGPAALNIVDGLYCPSRRERIRSDVHAVDSGRINDNQLLLNSWWPGGGTDYGGCIGRHQGFLLDADQSVVLPSADGRLPLCFVPGVDVADVAYKVTGDIGGAKAACRAEKGLGIFGQLNRGTTLAEIRDGICNTIMTGELQRITRLTTDGPFNANSGPVFSHDGWAIGGSSTLFTTGCPYPVDAKTNPLMNNGYFMSPGSEHVGGANFGLSDGRVRFLSTSINPNIFALLGSMADSEMAYLKDDLLP